MFSQEQYDMLLRCSEKKDISEWEHLTGLQDGQDCGSRVLAHDLSQIIRLILLSCLKKLTRFAVLFTAGGHAGKVFGQRSGGQLYWAGALDF